MLGFLKNLLLNGTGAELYWSKSRVYSPDIKAWLSADLVLRWNPNALLSKPGNWSPFEYTSENSVNFVDPSGFCAGCGSDLPKLIVKELHNLKVVKPLTTLSKRIS